MEGMLDGAVAIDPSTKQVRATNILRTVENVIAVLESSGSEAALF